MKTPRLNSRQRRARGMTALLSALAVFGPLTAKAIPYDFLKVTTNAVSGTFTSINGNGFIIASNSASPAGLISQNNSIYKSQFPVLFGSSGSITGWLARAADYATYTNVFILNNYNLKTNTVFGIWNITEETNQYSIQLLDGSGNVLAPPFTWRFLGYDDDADSGYIGWYHMNLDFSTGIFNPTNYATYTGSKQDCDGAFWDNLPLNTKKIVVTGKLTTNNHDGVVFYFAEPTPCRLICPSDIFITVCGPGTNVFFPPPTLYGDCGTNQPVLLSDFGSGSYFPLGTNVVVWGLPGSTNTCSFTVTVLSADDIPPIITCPSNIVVYTCGTNVPVSYTVTATDNSGTVIFTNCTPPSGWSFPLGTNQVSCMTMDACSNYATCAFDVIVLQKPLTWKLTCPPEVSSINVTGCPPLIPSVTHLVTISNECPVSLIITQSPPVGTATSSGLQWINIWVCPTNGGACSNCLVSVNAYLSPACCTIACPSNRVVTTCGTSAVVNYGSPTLGGGCAGFASGFCAPPSGSTFPLGTNTVICTATNGAGAVVDTCSFKIVVLSSPYTNGYDFLPVTITGAGAKFTSPNGNGFITVTNTGGPFLGLNNTPWTSQFPVLFPGNPTAPGWLAQADNFASYTNTFYLNNYYLSNTTAFGIWNITEEANTYRIQLFDGAGTQIAPVFTWNFLGYDDDALAGNISWYHMALNPATGFFAPTPYTGFGIDCDAAFWDNLPLNTRKIVVTGQLGAANADGVVFYFAERRRCPTIPCPSCNVDLGVAFTGGSIVLSWFTASGTGFILEEADQLVGPAPNWTTVTNTPTPVGETSQVVLPANRPQKFYRLHQTQP